MPKRPDPNFSDTQFARVPAFLRVRGDQIVGLEDHKGNLLGMPVTSTTSSGSEVDLSGVKAPGGTLTAGGSAIRLAFARRPLSVGILGDSISKMSSDYPAGFGGAAGDTAWSNYGWFSWMLFWSRADISAVNYAISGSTSGPMDGSEPSNVLTLQLPAALKAGHDIYTIAPIGINDTLLTGAQSVDYITQSVVRILNSNPSARVLLGTPMGVDSYVSSKSRISAIMSGMRGLANAFPDRVRLADFHSVNADPGSVADGAGYQTTFDDVTYDTTHPHIVGASFMGRMAYEAISDWLQPYQYARANADAPNLLTNPQLGGVSGTISNAGINSVAPTSWTVGRGSANVSYSAYKARRLPLVWKTGITYPVGARIAPVTPTGWHYIVLTSAATGATPPSAITAWGQSTPDAGGPVYLTIPANDTARTPDLGEDFVIDMTASSAGASDYVVLSQQVSAAALAGKQYAVGIVMEALGSPWGAAMLRVQQLNGASAKIVDHFGMGAWAKEHMNIFVLK